MNDERCMHGNITGVGPYCSRECAPDAEYGGAVSLDDPAFGPGSDDERLARAMAYVAAQKYPPKVWRPPPAQEDREKERLRIQAALLGQQHDTMYLELSALRRRVHKVRALCDDGWEDEGFGSSPPGSSGLVVYVDDVLAALDEG